MVIYSMMSSVDGYINGPNGELDWATVDEELHRFINERESHAVAHLYGRGLYETMQAYWPTGDQDPTSPDFIHEYARIWRGIPKVVFSRTLQGVEGNARLVRGNLREEVARLKAELSGEMIVGGAGLAASFLHLGLVDEIQMYVHPVLIGAGTPFYPPLDAPLPLRLTEEHRFGSGVLFLRYEVVRAG